ncbi:MAG: terpene cyclase/mutase family protein [Planctomycetes bacterium]|nr:terpene cyclase/mutase family protein [Planctomycetota bacterium]
MKTTCLLAVICLACPATGSPAAPAAGEAEARPASAVAGPSARDLLDSAIRRSLRWLSAHQAPDKSGSLGRPEFDTATAGLALLAFTGRRITHQEGTKLFNGAVDQGIGFLLARQEKEGEAAGRIGPAGPTLNHVIASMALAEALGLSKDRDRLGAPAAAAFRYLVSCQNSDGGWGSSPGEPSDTPTTAWAAWAGWTGRMALRLARVDAPGLDLDGSLARARLFIQGMVDSATGRVFYRVGEASTSSYKRFDIPYAEGIAPSRTAMALLAELLLGGRPFDPLPRSLAAQIRKRPLPERGPDGRIRDLDLCFLYFSTYALFRLGDPASLGSMGRIRDLLLLSQRLDEDLEGSWDPVDTWGPVGGRVYATALSTLVLELAFRYEELRGSPSGPAERPPEGAAPRPASASVR